MKNSIKKRYMVRMKRSVDQVADFHVEAKNAEEAEDVAFDRAIEEEWRWVWTHPDITIWNNVEVLFSESADAEYQRTFIKFNGRLRPMKRTLRDAAIIVIAMVIYAFGVMLVRAEPQTRFYDARGNSVGTSVPQSDGSTRYYDSRGNSLGTSTATTPGSTTYYSPLGTVTGKTVGPAGNGPFGGARR